MVRTPEGWMTPPVRSLAVAGVLRQWVLERLRAKGEVVVERAVSIEDISGNRCKGFYLLNSVIGVVLVRNFAGQDLPADDGLATIFNPFDLLE
ncbi:aminotransferase class IV [Marinobacter antarcticus]|uniref:aminotransferase class IV n=1 Tax=Marinobacter antarcticus TaxID=564117 RepID=UPI0026EB4A4C|nr:aminotransferase class IV [Marinobacter antarcticus]